MEPQEQTFSLAELDRRSDQEYLALSAAGRLAAPAIRQAAMEFSKLLRMAFRDGHNGFTLEQSRALVKFMDPLDGLRMAIGCFESDS